MTVARMNPVSMPRSALAALCGIGLLFASFATVALAHDTWLLPRSLRVPVGRAVTLSLTSGMAFPADDFAIKASRVARATVRLAGQVTPLATPVPASRSLHYEWTPRANGVGGLAVELAPNTLTLSPDKIEEYFADINASSELRAKWDSVPAPRHWRESYTKHAASFVRVGSPGADSSWREPLGMGLEIVPEVNPTALHAHQMFRVRVLRGGRPDPGVEVGLQREGDAHVAFTRTDEGGRATMRIPGSARWLVNVTDLRRSTRAGLEWESDFATLTIAVMK